GDNGPALQATFNLSLFSGLATDAAGNLYIADSNNNKVRKIAAGAGNTITTIAGTGQAGLAGNGMPATSAQLNFPAGISFDPAGNLFIADRLNYRVQRVAASDGKVTTVAGTSGKAGFGGDGGPATAALLGEVVGVAADPQGGLSIADFG